MKYLIIIVMMACLLSCISEKESRPSKVFQHNGAIPILLAEDSLTKAFNIAIGDIFTSVRKSKNGILEDYKPVLSAGLTYKTPWTRDASITIQYAGALLFPEIAKNTLSSLLREDPKDGKLKIGGEFWDSPLYAQGAWYHYLFSGDEEFLKLNLDAIINQLSKLEAEEYDAKKGLFRGGSFFNDGVSGYPKIYSPTGDFTDLEWPGNIKAWVKLNPDKVSKPGFGLPMMALSTNCIYYRAYCLVDSMAAELGIDSEYFKANEKAAKLKKCINDQFWDEKLKRYIYLIDPNGNSDYQEAAGLAMSILYNVADLEKAKQIMGSAHIEPAGITSIYPSFPRYLDVEKGEYGRHSGTVWPQVNGMWALAAVKANTPQLFSFELEQLKKAAIRDEQFYEVLHPKTGQAYGGMQEWNGGIEIRVSQPRQVWAATAYFSMILQGMIGMEYTSSGIVFKPSISQKYKDLSLYNVPYRNTRLNINIKGYGEKIKSFKVNDEIQKPIISKNDSGELNIEIEMEM